MTEMSVKEKAASEAAKQNKIQSVAILANKVADCEADPIDNAVTPIFTDEGKGVKSFKEGMNEVSNEINKPVDSQQPSSENKEKANK